MKITRLPTVSVSLLTCLVVGAGCSVYKISPTPPIGVYAVVVNKNNEFQADGPTANEVLKAIFLREQSEWPSGLPAVPYARPRDCQEDDGFVAKILDMSKDAVAEHWLGMKRKDGRKSPAVIESDELLLQLVSTYDGAVGVCSNATLSHPDAEDVRVLVTFTY